MPESCQEPWFFWAPQVKGGPWRTTRLIRGLEHEERLSELGLFNLREILWVCMNT